MKLLIKVTKDILRKSMNCGGDDITNNCAVAIAIRDIFPTAQVGQYSIIPRFGPCRNEEIIYLPKEASYFIAEFDSFASNKPKRLEMSEISFEIEVSDFLIDSINIEDIERSETLELIK